LWGTFKSLTGVSAVVEGQMKSSQQRGYRRTRRTAFAAVAIFAVTLFATETGTAAPSQSDFPPGQGAAFADTMKIDPRAGNLSIGIDFGKAAADHQNSAAQAISQAMDLGTIGTSLAAYGCDGSAPSVPSSQQPQALIADTRTPDQPQKAEQDETFAPGFHKSVEVTNGPTAKAITTTAPFGVAQVLNVGGGTATSTSEAVNGARKATAATDISGITLPGGVELRDLHWGAEYGSAGAPVGTFTIGSASIAGAPVPTNNPSDVLNQANAVLTLFGLHLTAPVTRVDTVNNTVYVDSMALSVVPNSTRDSITSAVINGIQPVREPAFDALLKAKCSLNTEITVFDIAVGSVTGAGSFNMLFGGVQAGSGEIATNPFTLGFVGAGSPGGVLPSTPGSPGTSGSSVVTPGGGAAATPAGGGGSGATTPVAAVLPKGARGGALAGVGLAGLAMMAAMAEGDRRKMRRAQREIPFTD
jgi:hypothetical protein